MNKKVIYMLLLGAGAIILLMIAIMLTNQYQSASARPAATPSTQSIVSPQTTKPQFTPPIPDATLSPEQTIALYFERWNAKDSEGMDALWIPADRGSNQEQYQLETLMYIDKISYHEQSKDTIPEELAAPFASAYDVAFVLSDYTIHYNEAGTQEYMQAEVERLDFYFLLIRERAGDHWLIAMQGY